jgi:signal transduction histidine kinase
MARAVKIFQRNAIDLMQTQSDLAQQTKVLEERLERELQITQLQRNFVAMITHEFRTPLTHIDGHAQRLISLSERLQPDDIAERAGRIRVGVSRIVSLIDSLVETARLIDGNGQLFFNKEPIDLVAVLHEACAQQRENAPRVHIRADYGDAPLPLHGDRRLLLQLFNNLISNAIKYSRGDATVDVRACRQDHTISVSVEDRGIGIPKRDLTRIFERYFRSSNIGAIGGTGIGLFIVSTVVRMHDGSITVDSEEGRGSTFTVTLQGVC